MTRAFLTELFLSGFHVS